MKTDDLKPILSWLKTTDLVEVSWRSSGEGFSLSTAESALPPPAASPGRFTAVLSPAVGLFEFSELGKARQASEGLAVTPQTVLGFVEISKGKSSPVTAPRAGRLARVLVAGGDPVEFGQPLFFIED